jgi:aminopeptidase N
LSGEPPPTTVPDMVYEVANLHPEMAFDFALAHWDVMEGLIEPSVRPRYMTWLIYRSTDVKMIAKLESFADKHIPVNARKDVRKAVALLRYLARVRNERLPEVDRWLKGRRDGME